jgi:hypothetical protein
MKLKEKSVEQKLLDAFGLTIRDLPFLVWKQVDLIDLIIAVGIGRIKAKNCSDCGSFRRHSSPAPRKKTKKK